MLLFLYLRQVLETYLLTYYLLLITYIYFDIFIVVLNKSALCFYSVQRQIRKVTPVFVRTNTREKEKRIIV